MPTTINTLPTLSTPAPSRSMTQAAFDAAADTYAAELTALIPLQNLRIGEMNTVAGEIATLGATATTKAGESATSAAAALVSQGVATAQATIATTKAAEGVVSAAAALVSQNAAATSAADANTHKLDAASSASAAAAAVAGIGYSDVVFINSASSPYTVLQATSGKLLSVDTSGGNVIVNLPAIAGLATPFVVGVKKSTGDANTVTINRASTDTFDDATTSKTISVQAGYTLIPDIDTSPDVWSAISFGGANAGLATASGLTMTTGKLLGRTTAGTGAIQEIEIGAFVAAQTDKATPVDADAFLGSDSAAASVAKKFTWANVKATMLAYFASVTTTLTNKRMTLRVGSTASSATPTINTDSYDVYQLTALAANITSFTTNLTGTPLEGDGLIIEITGTATRTIAWGAKFEASTVALPTTTVGTAKLTVGFLYNAVAAKWRCVGSC